MGETTNSCVPGIRLDQKSASMGDRPLARLDVDSKPGVAPLSRAYPGLEECRPFRTLASLRDQTQLAQKVSGTDPGEKADPSKEDELVMSSEN